MGCPSELLYCNSGSGAIRGKRSARAAAVLDGYHDAFKFGGRQREELAPLAKTRSTYRAR